jgi:LmbE family N-acetylglucosaminyl deacetylase
MEQLQISPSNTILVIAPHSDDESLGCGGLLLKYPKQCDVVVVTDGRYGGLPNQTHDEIIKIRQEELIQAMNYA